MCCALREELGLTPVMWNVTAHDWDATDPEALAARIQRGLQRNQRRHRGSNILLHDGGHQQLGTDRSITLTATGLLLEAWAGSGLRNVTVDAWAIEHSPLRSRLSRSTGVSQNAGTVTPCSPIAEDCLVATRVVRLWRTHQSSVSTGLKVVLVDKQRKLGRDLRYLYQSI